METQLASRRLARSERSAKIVFACTGCQERIKVKVALAGRSGRCPTCKSKVRVPRREAEEDRDDTSPLERPVAPRPIVLAPAPRASARVAPATRATAAHPWVLLLALLPLAAMTLQHRDLDVDGRLHRTIARESEAVAKHVVPFARSASFSIQEVVDELPGQALEGAYLTRASRLHWVLGAASACLFVVAVPLLFPWKGALDRALFAVGAFTATFGIAFLFLVQIALMRYYGDADDPRTDVFHSMLGFTLGVGVAEEVSKALPILITIMMGKTLDWRRACLFGVASGVGFGVFEGIHYASTMYNGVYFRDVYVVRFVSCVALHAVWSGSAGILLAERQATVRGARLGDLRWVLPAVLAGPIILHGFYDTLLKFGYAGLALLAALGSLAWFATEVRRMEATCVATA